MKIFNLIGLLSITGLISITFVSHAQVIDNQKDSIYTYQPAGKRGIGKFYMGREISDSPAFNKRAFKFYENKKRNIELKVSDAIDSLPITDSSVVADIGAGSAAYSTLISKKITNGKVYAVDKQETVLQHIKKEISKLKFKNVDVVKGDDYSPNLPPQSLDLAIMADVYHELIYPHEYLQSLIKILKPGGLLVLIEYRAEEGEPSLHTLTVAQANRELSANGLTLKADKEFLPYQHFLVYGKRP